MRVGREGMGCRRENMDGMGCISASIMINMGNMAVMD